VGDPDHNWGNLILAIDPELLVGQEEFHQMKALREAVKSCSRLPGLDRASEQIHKSAGEKHQSFVEPGIIFGNGTE
jgi:LDH2 family malate/lactate/ureidoglycolate dehydrogenase